MTKTATKKKPSKRVAKPKCKATKPLYWYKIDEVFGRPPRDDLVGKQIGMPYKKGKVGSYTIVDTETGKMRWGFTGTFVGLEPKMATT